MDLNRGWGQTHNFYTTAKLSMATPIRTASSAFFADGLGLLQSLHKDLHWLSTGDCQTILKNEEGNRLNAIHPSLTDIGIYLFQILVRVENFLRLLHIQSHVLHHLQQILVMIQLLALDKITIHHGNGHFVQFSVCSSPLTQPMSLLGIARAHNVVIEIKADTLTRTQNLCSHSRISHCTGAIGLSDKIIDRHRIFGGRGRM